MSGNALDWWTNVEVDFYKRKQHKTFKMHMDFEEEKELQP